MCVCMHACSYMYLCGCVHVSLCICAGSYGHLWAYSHKYIMYDVVAYVHVRTYVSVYALFEERVLMLEMLLAQCVWSFLGNRILHVACYSQDIQVCWQNTYQAN